MDKTVFDEASQVVVMSFGWRSLIDVFLRLMVLKSAVSLAALLAQDGRVLQSSERLLRRFKVKHIIRTGSNLSGFTILLAANDLFVLFNSIPQLVPVVGNFLHRDVVLLLLELI